MKCTRTLLKVVGRSPTRWLILRCTLYILSLRRGIFFIFLYRFQRSEFLFSFFFFFLLNSSPTGFLRASRFAANHGLLGATRNETGQECANPVRRNDEVNDDDASLISRTQRVRAMNIRDTTRFDFYIFDIIKGLLCLASGLASRLSRFYRLQSFLYWRSEMGCSRNVRNEYTKNTAPIRKSDQNINEDTF